jgi:hypothetical protein
MELFRRLLHLRATSARMWTDMPIDTFRLREAFPEALDSSSLDAYTAPAKPLSDLLSGISVEALFKEFGEAPLLWTWLNKTDHLSDAYLCDIQQSTGRNPHILRRAKSALLDMDTKSRKIETLLGQYAFCQKMEAFDTVAAVTRLEGYLRGKKPNKEEYSLDVLCAENDTSTGFCRKWAHAPYNIYLDSPYALALCRNKEPMVLTGLFHEAPKILGIRQLQGVRQRTASHSKVKTTNHPARVRWEEYFLHVFSIWAKEQGYTTLRIQSASNNDWIKYDPKKLAAGIRRYDETARKNGFSQKEDQNWYKGL